MLWRSAGNDIAVAAPLVVAHRADPFHVAQQHRQRACQIVRVNAERLEQPWQLVRRMLPLMNQTFQLDGRNPQIARDAVELDTVELPHLADLATMLEPVGEGR